MNSYNPQTLTQLLATQREAIDAAARHLTGAAPAASHDPNAQQVGADHFIKLRDAVAKTRHAFQGDVGAARALEYLQALLEDAYLGGIEKAGAQEVWGIFNAGHLGATAGLQTCMDAASGPARSPLTAELPEDLAAQPPVQAALLQVLSSAIAQAQIRQVDAAVAATAATKAFMAGLAEFALAQEKTAGVAGTTSPAPAIGDQFGGRIYAGTTEIDGKPAHLILLDGEIYGVDWDAAMKWAASIGGSLPTRREQRLLFANQKVAFKENWYWSCEQRADRPTSAWGQYFSIGNQYSDIKSCCEFARAVRRLPV